MDIDEGKLFLGGIAWETTDEKLREHFGNYGEVREAVIMRDKITGRPRGFGFIGFSDPSVLDAVLQDTHTIDGRTVEVKRALSREEQRTSSRPANPSSGRSSTNAGNFRTKKIFVGGLPSTLTEEEFRQYFENYGNVTDVVIMYDQNTRRPRGFGFITFDNEDSVDRVLEKNFHDLDNKQVEVKAALPKEANPGGGGHGGSYQSYGSGANAASFDAQMNGNRFMQPQAAVGAFPSYPGYGGANFGYRAGFTGPGGPYGIPGIPNAAGYMGGPPGGMKSQWNGQIPGYGANAGYGAPFSAMVPAPGGASVYGYGGYGGNDGGSYGNSGAVDGRSGGGVPNSNSGGGSNGSREQQQQQGSGGYVAGSGGYGNNNGSSGYSGGGAW